MNTSSYLERLKPDKRTVSPCINCLLETEERVAEGDFSRFALGDRLWYSTFQQEILVLEQVLKTYHPQSILEVGSGTGRVIKSVLDILPNVYVTGTELNEITFNFVRQRFLCDARVSIEKVNIVDYLKNSPHYDMALCLMNTFGNINDQNVFSGLLNCADYFVFSLYNRDFDFQRDLMYKARGHTHFEFKDNRYCFEDSWVKGLVSRSYTDDEIKELVASAGSQIVEFKNLGMLFFVVASKSK